MDLNFDWFESTLLIVFILVCFGIYLMTRSRVLRQYDQEDPAKKRKNAKLELWTGVIIALLSLSGHVYVQIDISRTPGLLRPIASMTSEPLLFFTIVGFIAGLTLIAIGLFKLSHLAKKEDKSTWVNK
jgi:uncharacterized membrane protein YfcA